MRPGVRRRSGRSVTPTDSALCRRISDSKEALQAGTSGRDALTLQIAAARQELKDRKRAFRAGPVPEIILE